MRRRRRQLNFLAAKTALRMDAIKKGESPELALESNYRAGLVPPFCFDVARDFFSAAAAK